jgi:putative flippase GtrA
MEERASDPGSPQRLRALLEQPLMRRLVHVARVAFVGATGLMLQTIVFELAGVQFGILKPSTAALLGGELAILSNFVLNNRFNFETPSNDSLPRRLLRFHFVVAGSVFLQ